MLARLFVFFGGLLIVGLFSLLFAPMFVDWAGYRSAFEREASRIVGQPVRVEGKATARILPFPSVTFTNVVIDGADNLSSARASAFSMDAELAPFLNGEIRIFDMRIDQADIRLKLDQNGQALWSLPSNEVLNGNSVALEQININEARFTFEQSGKQPILFDAINGKISALSLSGPWLAEGRFNNGSTTYDARLSTSAKIEGETVRARVSLSPQGGDYQAEFDGRVSLTDSTPSYAGKIDLSIFGPPNDNASKSQRLADITGAFLVDKAGIKVDDAALTAGSNDKPYRADGSLSLTFGEQPRFDILLKGQQISFSDIGGNAKNDRVTSGVPLAERFATLQALLAKIPVPQIPGQIDLSLPALVVGDTILRDLQIKAAPSKAGWQIDRYYIELPGRTIVEGAGELSLSEISAFSGQLTVATKQPTGLANWIGLKAGDAFRALPAAGFSARVNLSNQRQTLRDVEFRAGNSVLRGFIDRQVPEGATTQLSIELNGENADLDVLSSLIDLVKVEQENLANQEIELKLTSAPAFGMGWQAEQLNFGGRLKDQTLMIDQANATGIFGADITLSGSVADIYSLGRGKLESVVSAVDPLPFLAALSEQYPGQQWLKTVNDRALYAGTSLADAKLTALVELGAIEGDQLKKSAIYQFESTGLSFNGRLQNAPESGYLFEATGEMVNGETLLAALGLPVSDPLTALNLLEPVVFEASFVAKSGQFVSGSLKAKSENDIFEIGLGNGPQPFNLVLSDATSYALPAGFVMPGAAFGLPVQLTGTWQSNKGELVFQKLEGLIAEVPVAGQLTVYPNDRPKLIGKMTAGLVPFALLEEIAFGPLAANGDALASFPNGLSLPFDADIFLNAAEVDGFSSGPLTNLTAQILIKGDTLRLTDVKANLAEGQAIGSLEIEKNNADSIFRLSGAVENASVAAINKDTLSGRANLKFELSGSGSTLDELRSSLTGSGILSGKDLVLTGISTNGFEGFLAEADALEIAPDAVSTLEMTTRMLLIGKTNLPEVQTAFSVTSGVARAAQTIITIDGGTLALEPQLDLRSGQTEINAELVFDAGDSAVVGLDPALKLGLTGQWNGLSLTIDPQSIQGFLSQRALEREEVRVEAIQSALMEKQRLRRENRYYTSLIDARAKAEAERLAEIERLVEEAEKAERARIEQSKIDQELLEKQLLEKELLEKEQQANEAVDGRLDNQRDGMQLAPLKTPSDLPLNIDALIKELEAPVQP